MIDRIRETGGRFTFGTLVVATMVVILIPASAGAKVKPLDGLVYQAKGKVTGYVQVDKGKIVAASFNVIFRDKQNKTCVPEGFLAQTGGYIGVSFATTKKVKLNGKGKFTVRNKANSSFPGLKATVKGRFKSASKASFSAVLKAGGCTAKAFFPKASST